MARMTLRSRSAAGVRRLSSSRYFAGMPSGSKSSVLQRRGDFAQSRVPGETRPAPVKTAAPASRASQPAEPVGSGSSWSLWHAADSGYRLE